MSFKQWMTSTSYWSVSAGGMAGAIRRLCQLWLFVSVIPADTELAYCSSLHLLPLDEWHRAAQIHRKPVSALPHHHCGSTLVFRDFSSCTQISECKIVERPSLQVVFFPFFKISVKTVNLNVRLCSLICVSVCGPGYRKDTALQIYDTHSTGKGAKEGLGLMQKFDLTKGCMWEIWFLTFFLKMKICEENKYLRKK